MQKLDGELSRPGFEWTTSIRAKLHGREDEALFDTLEKLGRELADCAKDREIFISKPVSAPADIETDEGCLQAIGNLASGKSAFGVKGLYGKNEQKDKIKRVLITGNPPKSEHEWQYVHRYVNLRRELPRIPFASVSPVPSAVKDFEAFSALAKAGQRLAEIHVRYEQQLEHPLTKKEKQGEKLDYRVTKLKLNKDKTALIYNQFLTLSGIPKETYEYRLGNRSALEWVIDQYQVSTDKRSGIINDPNRPDEQIERYVEDQVLVLRRRLSAASTALRAAEDKRDSALGAEARSQAEDRIRRVQEEMDELEAETHRLQRREDSDYDRWRKHAHQRRYRPRRWRLWKSLNRRRAVVKLNTAKWRSCYAQRRGIKHRLQANSRSVARQGRS